MSTPPLAFTIIFDDKEDNADKDSCALAPIDDWDYYLAHKEETHDEDVESFLAGSVATNSHDEFLILAQIQW